jgi:EpsI family protein
MPAGNYDFQSLLRSKYARILTLVLVMQGALFYAASRSEAVPQAQALENFPTKIGEWARVRQGVVDEDTLRILRADDTMSRVYANARGQGVDLWVAYFRTQRTGQSPHSPKNCLPGSGWSQSVNEYDDIEIAEMHETLHINKFVVQKGGQKAMALYWYQTPKRVIASEFAAKFWLVADSIATHRSDTAIVKVTVGVTGDDNDAALQQGTRFIQATYPVLRTFLPK